MWISVKGFGWPYLGRLPDTSTLRELSLCFLFKRMAATSIPEQAPREVSKAFIGPMPRGRATFEGGAEDDGFRMPESKTIECPSASLPMNRSSSTQFRSTIDVVVVSSSLTLS